MAEQVLHSPNWPMDKTDEKREKNQEKRIIHPDAYRSKSKKRLYRRPTFPALGREDQQILQEISAQHQRASKDKETLQQSTFKWNNGVYNSAEITGIDDAKRKQQSHTISDNTAGKRAPTSIMKTAPSKKESAKSVTFAVPDASDEKDYQEYKASKYILADEDEDIDSEYYSDGDYTESDTDTSYTDTDTSYTDTDTSYTDTDTSYDSGGSYEPGLSPSEIEEERNYMRAKFRNRLIIGGLLLGSIVYFGASFYSSIEEVIDYSYWKCFKSPH